MPVNLSLQESQKFSGLWVKDTVANDTVFMAHNHQDAQEITPHFLKSVKIFGLKINLTKIEFTYQPCMGSHDIGQD